MKLAKRIVAYLMLVAMVVTSAVPNAIVNVSAKTSDTETESLSSNAALASNDVATASSSSGFVTTNGTKFWLDGGEFPYCGTNCYYINFKPKEDIDALFEGAEEMGINVIRTWGHLDAGTIQKGQTNGEKQVFSNSVDGTGEKDGTYYQYWDDDLGKPVVNLGENGIGRLDYTVGQAKEHGVKLILTLTNNWKEFGGMAQYIKWAGLSEHDEFYTNETIKGWYKDYIETLLNHVNPYTGLAYKDDPTIFAWELSNEPRATSDAAEGAGNAEDILLKWVEEMSAYIKSIDSNHMVSVGDEGFFDYAYETGDICSEAGYDKGWYWHGCEGYNYADLVAVKDVDFGTPHIYIKDWNMGADMGTGAEVSTEGSVALWLKHHAEVTHKLNKPIILEEFGFNATKETTLKPDIASFFTWMYDTLDEYEYAGSNFWMLADYVDGTPYPNYDGYNVYSCTLEDLEKDGITDENSIKLVTEREPAYDIIVAHNEKVKANADNNAINPGTIKVDLANAAATSVDMNLQTGASFSNITMNGMELTKGTDYTVSGDTVTFTASFLSSLEEGYSYVTFNFSQGRNPELTIDVYDSRITSAEFGVTEATFDKNPKVAKNITIPVTVNDGGALKSVKLRGTGSQRTELEQGSDYTYDDNGTTATITLLKSYLSTLTGETAVIEADYTKGSDPAITITLKDTTGLDVIDDFESYASSDDINANWSKNNNGSHVEGALVTDKTSSQAMEYKYTLGEYCGLTKSLGSVDASSFEGIEFWYQPDGSGNKLTIQVADASGNLWEHYITMSSSEAQKVQIPYSDFTVKSGYGDENATMGDSKFKEFSIYVDKVSEVVIGSLYFDDIVFYSNTSAEEEVKVTGVTLSTDSVSVEEGATETITATVSPAGATNRSVKWSSSDDTIATISGGKITGVKAGTATITVTTSDGGFTASCEVTVTAKATTTQGADNSTVGPVNTTETPDGTTAGPVSTTETPADDPSDDGEDKIVYLLDDFSTCTLGTNGIINNWKPIGGWQYRAGNAASSGVAATTIAYDEEKEALKVDLDYSADTDQSWSEAKVNTWTVEEGIDLSQTNQLRFDMTYPKEYEGFGIKIFGNNYNLGSDAIIEGEASIKNKVDNGDGTITANIIMQYKKGITTPLNSICIGFVGKYSDFVGSIWIDNVAIWSAIVGVELPATNGEVTTVDLSKMPESVQLADSEATAEAAAAYSYLKGVTADDKVLFGHQNDNSRTVAGGESDTKDMTGSYSAVVAYDTLALVGSELGVSMEEGYASTLASAKAAAEEGAIISLSTHMPNFNTMWYEGNKDYSEYGFDSSKDLARNCAENSLPGKKCNALYTGYLDIIVQFAKDMEGTPIIFRPLHENNGGWFWWGSSTTAETYKALYRYTVEYLQKNGVHNFIYEYSPNGPFESEEDFLQRYPGDEYVDIFGFDYYDDCSVGSEYSDTFEKNLDASCKIISKLAEERGKVAVIAEAGVRVTKEDGSSEGLLEEGNPITGKGWYEMVNDVAKANDIAYFLVWANFSNQNFYVPYIVEDGRCHELGPDFIDFYNSDSSVFADGANYKEAIKKNVTSTSYTNVCGYMIDPVNFQEVLKATTFHAGVKNATDVSFVIYRTEADENPVVVKAEKNEDGIYEAAITDEVLAEIGEAEIAKVQLKGDDTVIATAKYVSFNVNKAAAPAGTIDNFEYYYGDQEYLESKYCNSNSAGGCASSVTLTKRGAKDGTYAGAFSYSLTHTAAGTEVYTGTGRNLAVTDYSKDADGNETNAISMWVKPDGQGQKLVIQFVSGGYEFEAFLTDFMKGTEAQYVTIPFSAFKPKVTGQVFNPAKVTALNFYCNSIRTNDAYSVDSTIYFDKIKAIKADETQIADVAEASGNYVLSDTQLDGEQDEERPVVNVTGVTLSETAVSLKEGESVVLKATIEPEEADNIEATWESSDDTVATVSATGKVEALKEGTATITVTTADGGFTATCEVTVTKKAETTTEDAGSSTEDPDGTTAGPSNTTENPDGTTAGPSNTTENPDGTTAEPGNTTENPDGTTAEPGSTTENLDGTTAGPSNTTETPDVSTEDPTGSSTTETPDVTTQENPGTSTETPGTDVEVSAIEIEPGTATIEVGKTTTLKASITPATATNQNVSWDSKNKDVAMIDRTGKVTGLAEGTAIITATTDNGKMATCLVTVVKASIGDSQNVAVTGITLSDTKWLAKEGDTLTLVYTISPADATNKTVTWKSDNENVVSVDAKGCMTALSEGITTVRVIAEDGNVSASCVVTVTKEQPSDVLVTEVRLDRTTIGLKSGERYQLSPSVSPSNATNKVLSYTVDNQNVVSVSANGMITAISEGQAVITISATDGSEKRTTCLVTVTDTEISVNSVTLNQTELELVEGGDQVQLFATVSPSSATNQNLTWISSNQNVVSVDANGKLTIFGIGTATITVVTEDGGKMASCAVTVTSKQSNVVPVTQVNLDYTKWSMQPGDQKVLSAVVSPADATDQTLTWSTNDDTIASVDAYGVVTAIGEGTAIIAATSKNGKTAICVITISKNNTTVLAENITLNETVLNLSIGDEEQLIPTITPASATNKTVSWTVDVNGVVVVEDGIITAIGNGVATVTASLQDGPTAKCVIFVSEEDDDLDDDDNNTGNSNNTTQAPADANQNPAGTTQAPAGTNQTPASTTQAPAGSDNTILITSIEVAESVLEVVAGNTIQVETMVLPVNATNSQLTYTSSKKSIATVNAYGEVKAKKPGVTQITIVSSNGKAAVCQVIVKPAKVTKLKKSKAGSSAISLKWKKQAGVSGYKVYVYNAKTKKYKLYKSTKSNKITVKKLKGKTTYKFKVMAYKKTASGVIKGATSKALSVKTK